MQQINTLPPKKVDIGLHIWWLYGGSSAQHGDINNQKAGYLVKGAPAGREQSLGLLQGHDLPSPLGMLKLSTW